MPLSVVIELTDEQILVLLHDLPGQAGIRAWFEAAIDGKCYKCQTRMLSEGTKILMDDPTILSIPADKTALTRVISAHPNYKDRAASERG